MRGLKPAQVKKCQDTMEAYNFHLNWYLNDTTCAIISIYSPWKMLHVLYMSWQTRMFTSLTSNLVLK